MALPLYIDEMRKHDNSRVYFVRMKFDKELDSQDFELSVNGSNIYFNKELSEENQLSILDQNDCPFPEGKIPYFRLTSLTSQAKGSEEEFIEAFEKFLREYCCDKA